jgi:hypothetical protein
MGIEVIHHKQDRISIKGILIDKPLHLVRPVYLGSMFIDVCLAVAAQRFREHEDAAGYATNIYRVCPKWFSPFPWNGFSFMVKQLQINHDGHVVDRFKSASASPGEPC